jgi:hypothetical protein
MSHLNVIVCWRIRVSAQSSLCRAGQKRPYQSADNKNCAYYHKEVPGNGSLIRTNTRLLGRSIPFHRTARKAIPGFWEPSAGSTQKTEYVTSAMHIYENKLNYIVSVSATHNAEA